MHLSPNLVVAELLGLRFINNDDSVCLSTIKNVAFKGSIVVYKNKGKISIYME